MRLSTNSPASTLFLGTRVRETILKWIKPVSYYNVATPDEYDSLLRRRLDHPAIVAPPIGAPVKKGPVKP